MTPCSFPLVSFWFDARKIGASCDGAALMSVCRVSGIARLPYKEIRRDTRVRLRMMARLWISESTREKGLKFYSNCEFNCGYCWFLFFLIFFFFIRKVRFLRFLLSMIGIFCSFFCFLWNVKQGTSI